MIDPRDLTYNAAARAGALEAVGWPVETRRTALAISLAELGETSPAGIRTGINERPGIERSHGPWQINLEAHPHVGEDCAHDLICSTKEALRISGGGFNFGPWGAYSSGAYTGHLGRADQALGASSRPSPEDPLPYIDPGALAAAGPHPGDPSKPVETRPGGQANNYSVPQGPGILRGAEQLAVAGGVLVVAGVLAFMGLRRLAG